MSITQAEVIQRVREAIAANGGSQKITATQWGISSAYMNDILHGRREPGRKVLDALGLEKVVEYRTKETGSE